ncbi:hypothetical protein BH11PAT2_BH11PAT2_07130 [soil metagenome]
MTIAESVMGDKGSGTWGSRIGSVLGDWVLVGVIVLSSSLCFGLGLLTARANAPKGPDSSLWIEQLPATERAGAVVSSTGATEGTAAGTAAVPTQTPSKVTKALPAQPAAAAGAISPSSTAHNYVASKTGSKYYLPSCGTVSRIKEENRVYFATKSDAEKAGYEPSTSCKGL